MRNQTYEHHLISEIIKEHKMFLFIWVLGGIVYEFIKLLYPMMLGKILDAITIYKEMDLFVLGAIGYITVFVADKFFYMLVSRLNIIVNEKVTVSYRSKILKKILLLEEQNKEGMPIGKRTELVLQGAKNIFEIIFLHMEITASVVKSIIILFVLVRVNIFLFLGAVVWLPLMFFVSKRLGKILKRRSDDKQKVYQKYRGWLIEVFKGISTIRKYDMTCQILGYTQEKEVTYQKETKKSEYLSLKVEFITQFMLNLLNISIYVLASVLIFKEKLTIGSYIMVFEYYYMIQNSITKINGSYSQIKDKDILLEQVQELFVEDKPVEYAGNKLTEGIAGDIEFKNVSFSYESGKKVLDGCSFRVEAGREVTFVGRSGEGKSTLLKLIAGMYPAQEGQMLLSGRKIESYDERYLHEQVMLLSQEKLLLNGTMRENLCLGKRIGDRELSKVLQQVGLLHIVNQLPQKLDTLIQDNECQLSEGEYQRFNIARVLLSKPKILMIDEGTASLDIAEEEKLRDMLRENMVGVTILYVSHREESIVKSPRVIFLKNGRAKETMN